MAKVDKMRTVGTELLNFSYNNFLEDAKKYGWKVSRSIATTIKNNYRPDRSIRRLLRNMNFIDELIKLKFKNINTRAGNMNTLRIFFLSIYPEKRHELISSTLVLTPDEYYIKSETAAKLRLERLKQVSTITEKTIFKFVEDLKKNGSLEAKVLLLALSTGRRKIEILKISNKPTKFDNENIIFNTLAKKKENDEYKIPYYFLTYDEISNYWDFVRSRTPTNLTNVETASLINPKLNELLKKYLNMTTGAHFLRKIYVAYSFKDKPPEWDGIIWINKILCHEMINMDSALNYATLRMGDKDTFKNLENKSTATFDRFKKAVDNLRQQKIKPTYAVLLKAGFGSPTIKKYIKLV